MNSVQPVLQLQGIFKEYTTKTEPISILKGIDLSFYQKEIVSIMGPSGSGKSTLLGIMGTLDAPTQGRVILEGQNLSGMSEQQLSDSRAYKIGFVFQSFNLITTMNALENVMLPLTCIKGSKQTQMRKQATHMLKLVGMEERMKHLPHQLSGGQQQRVAIARSLINKPAVVIADEPTGNLDKSTGQSILDLIVDLKQKLGMTFILATHDLEVAAQSDRVIHIEDGTIVERESANTTAGRSDISDVDPISH